MAAHTDASEMQGPANTGESLVSYNHLESLCLTSRAGALTIMTLPAEIRQAIYSFYLVNDAATQLSFVRYEQRHRCRDCTPTADVHQYRTKLRYNVSKSSIYYEGCSLTKLSCFREEILEYMAKELPLVADMRFEYCWGLCNYTRLSKSLPENYRLNLKRIVIDSQAPKYLARWITQIDRDFPASRSLTLPLSGVRSRIVINGFHPAQQLVARLNISSEERRAVLQRELFDPIPGGVAIVKQALPPRPIRRWELCYRAEVSYFQAILKNRLGGGLAVVWLFSLCRSVLSTGLADISLQVAVFRESKNFEAELSFTQAFDKYEALVARDPENIRWKCFT